MHSKSSNGAGYQRRLCRLHGWMFSSPAWKHDAAVSRRLDQRPPEILSSLTILWSQTNSFANKSSLLNHTCFCFWSLPLTVQKKISVVLITELLWAWERETSCMPSPVTCVSTRWHRKRTHWNLFLTFLFYHFIKMLTQDLYQDQMQNLLQSINLCWFLVPHAQSVSGDRL